MSVVINTDIGSNAYIKLMSRDFKSGDLLMLTKKESVNLRKEGDRYLFDWDWSTTFLVVDVDTSAFEKLTLPKDKGFETTRIEIAESPLQYEFILLLEENGEKYSIFCRGELYVKQTGRVIIKDMCGCPVCMNEPNIAAITIGEHSDYRGRVYTTWGKWKLDRDGKLYRNRIVDYIEVDAVESAGGKVRINASEFEEKQVGGIYTGGHVIVDLAPDDEHNFSEYEVCPYM